jgi:uncharacterized ParB-like nuclease family protein
MPGVEGVQQISLSDLLSLSDAGILTAEEMDKIRKINKAHVNVLSNSDESEWPPIEVAHVQISGLNLHVQDKYIAADGMHRWRAAIKKKKKDISAHIGSYASVDDVLLAFLTANTKHGQPASMRARLQASLVMIRRGDITMPGDIARTVGVKPLQIFYALNKESETTEAKDGDAETPDRREVRLLCSAVERFYKHQQDLLSRFTGVYRYEDEVAIVGNEIHEYYQSLGQKQQVQLTDSLYTLIDVSLFVGANKLAND